jgi:hypothetical protein
VHNWYQLIVNPPKVHLKPNKGYTLYQYTKAIIKLACRCAKTNVTTNEIARFGGLNFFLGCLKWLKF